MAYLNTQFSKQELTYVVDSAPLAKPQPKVKTVETAELTENSNFYIASQLKDEKQKLISALAQFPVTALWILRQYEQAENNAAQEDDASIDVEYSTELSAVSQCFDVLVDKYNSEAVNVEFRSFAFFSIFLRPLSWSLMICVIPGK